MVPDLSIQIWIHLWAPLAYYVSHLGHLEGTAGLAGLLKASASIQNGYIAPNLLFKTLNPKLEPFYKSLQIPTELTPWPEVPEGVPRRVSVNSFGMLPLDTPICIFSY